MSAEGGELPDHYPDRELLASTADCLRIWEIYRNEFSDPYQSSYVGGNASGGAAAQQGEGSQLPFSLREKSVLAHSKNTKSPPAPLTSFSWNTPSPNLIVTSSIDTTCTIWDLPTRTALTQLIAHDREVYDVDWCPGSADVFASVGADGSVRVFDLRSLEHSTIIYETGTAPGATESRPGTSMSTSSRATSTRSVPAAPLLRIAFNPWDANYLATFHLESDSVQILDVRAPGSPILELRGHSAAVNAIAWGPPSIGAGCWDRARGWSVLLLTTRKCWYMILPRRRCEPPLHREDAVGTVTLPRLRQDRWDIRIPPRHLAARPARRQQRVLQAVLALAPRFRFWRIRHRIRTWSTTSRGCVPVVVVFRRE